MNLFHSYELTEVVYQNSRSQINRAVSKLDGSKISIKTIDSGFLHNRAKEYLESEFNILCRLNHRGIVKVDKSKTNIEQLFIVLEDFPSQNLGQLMLQSISIPNFLTIAIQLVSALEEIHYQGIVHGNIQPNCIAIDPKSWQLKIIDLGGAIDLNSDNPTPPPKLSELNLAYIAPEQTGRIKVAIDYRTDFYTLGILLYRLVTGELPYRAQDSLELIHCHLAQKPLAPCYADVSVPAAISAIIMKLLAKNPSERYQSAVAIKLDLQHCQSQYLKKGTIEQIELGILDSCSKFAIPDRLYGRSQALAQIAESIAHIDRGAARMLLLSGASGTGKTALVEKTIPTIIGSRGYFIRGRFEASTSSIPYQAITQALRELMRKLLKETSACRQVWQQKIQQAIADKGKLITNILPELELIIGSQPDLPQVTPQENQRRFNSVFVSFIQVFARSKSHLVLFLDDLQWADSASLNLIELLAQDKENRHLLIVGAYRDINCNCALAKTIESIALTMPIDRIALQPLSSEEINSLLVDTLYCHPQCSQALAQLLHRRTRGNPFFIVRLLQTFHREQLITFNSTTLSWQWCIDRIRTTTITNYDVLELVGQNFRQLPLLCQQVLKLASCLGGRFNILKLTDLWQETILKLTDFTTPLDREAIALVLNDALEAGIIIFEDRSSAADYQFLHHHIESAIYASITEIELSQLHLVIGQDLLRQTKAIEVKSNIFEVVHHLNIARTGVRSSLDTNYLAQLNITASQKAKSANAYEVAANYSDIALELLPTSAWQDNYALILAAYQEAIEIEYLVMRNSIYAQQLCNIVLTQAETVLDCIPIYKRQIQTHIAQNQMKLAIDIGLHVLRLLDINLSDPATGSTENALPIEIDSREIESWGNLAAMSDRHKIAAMEIIVTIIPPVYIAKPQLLSLLVEKAIALSLQYGNCPLSAYAYAFYGLLLCATDDIEVGYQLGKLALKLQAEFDAKEIKSKVGFLFNNMIRHWREPAVSTLDHFLEGIKDGIEVGDIEHACFHSTRYCAHLFYVGKSLSAVDQTLKQIKFISGLKQDFQLNYARMWHQLNLNLRGIAQDEFLLIGDSFDETKFLNLWQKENNTMSLFSFCLIKLVLNYLFGDYQQAIVYALKGKQYLEASVGLMDFGMYHFYYCMAMLAVSSQDKDSWLKYFSEISACQTKIGYWSNHAPSNYLNKHELIAAEIAKVSGEHEQAAKHYDRAIVEASQAGYIHESALAEELAGEFYLSQGKTKIASYYLNDAYKSYRHWGALAKTKQLESKHSPLLNLIHSLEFADNSDRYSDPESDLVQSYSNLANLDLFSIIKASQAISSEIVLDSLLSKMMAIVMENAGAQKSILLLKQNSELIVAASASMESEQAVDLPCLSISEYHHLPHSIINYVQSTRETVLLEQASQSGMFTDDPYTIEFQPKSILCCPMVYQHQLQGIIYLENSLVAGAFTSQKLAVLQVLLSQVSISIANARLYKDLEDHASVQKSLKQKEILLKEIHHRVKNNLFVVSSLLDFQSTYVEDPEVNKLLENCQNRITAMAMVHQHLYGDSELDKINFAQYIESLLDNLAYSQGSKERNINLILDLEPIELNIESANPCGLIVNELVSNALEHGFRDRQSGNIWLKLQHNIDNKIVLTIKDDGVGFEAGKNLHNSESLGLELICTLVEQIDGQITLDSSVGTKIEIVFDELDYHSRI